MLKKIGKSLIAAFIAGAMSVYATVSLEWSPSFADVVKGVEATATQTIGLYATTAGENVTTLNVKVTMPAGVTVADGVTAGTTNSVIWNDAIFTAAANNALKKTVTGTELTISIAPSAAAKLSKTPNLAITSGVKTKICDVTFAIDATMISEDVNSLNIPAVVAAFQVDWKASTAYSTDNLNLAFAIYHDSFTFFTNDGVSFECDEVNSASAQPYVIDFSDTTLFTCKAWDGEALSDSTEFEISAVFIDGDNAEEVNGKWFIDDEPIGTFTINGQTVDFVPEPFYNGEFTLSYAVISTKDGMDAYSNGTIPIKVTPVLFAPDVTITEVPETVDEMGEWTFTFTLKDGEGRTLANFDEELVATGADFELKIEDYTVGEAVVGADGTQTYTVTVNTDATLFPFDTVLHTDATNQKDVTLALTLTDKSEPNCVAGDTADFKVQDVDQDPEEIDFDVNIEPGEAFVNDALSSSINENFEATPDPDGDVIGYDVVWTCNGNATDYTTAEVPADIVKRGEVWRATYTPYTMVFGVKKSYPELADGGEIVISNSNPVITTADEAPLFIRKGAETSKDIVLTATDPDEDDVLSVEIKTQDAKCNAVANGMTITVTVVDENAEFYGDNAAIITYVVNDNDTGTSQEQSIVVSYRENVVPTITVVTAPPESIPEATDGEATTFTASISAIDDPEHLVEPCGMADIQWNVYAEDGVTELEGWTVTPGTISKNGETWTQEVTVATAGYDTINNDNGPRASTATVVLKATATDVLEGEAYQTWTITVSDVDRKPVVPAAAAISYNLKPAAGEAQEGISTLPSIYAGDEITANINADASVDPDGDDVTYQFAWTKNSAPADDEWKAEGVLNTQVKGETWNLYVRAIAKPAYDAQGADADYASDMYKATTFTVENTAPTAQDDDAQTFEDRSVNVDLTELAADVDGDALTYSVDATSAQGGTVTVDAAGLATYMPAADFNGEDSFTYTVTDSSNATATATITVTVTAVNDQPSTTVNPIAFERDAQTGAYVETTATFTVNPGAENETDQTFEIVDMVVTDEGGILNGNPTMSFDGTTLTVVAKPVAEPDPSAKAFVKFKIKDSGGTDNDGVDTSEEYEIMICTNPPPQLVEGSVVIKQNGQTGTEVGAVTETDSPVTLTLQAKDGVVEGAPAPSGVASFTLTAFINGEEVDDVSAWVSVTPKPSTGTAAATFTATLTPNYDMIFMQEPAQPRPSKITVKFTVKATDGDGVSAQIWESNEFEVSDVDRPSAAPTSVVLKGVDGEGAEVASIRTADTINAVVTPEDFAALADEDGDVATKYVYTWKKNGEVIEGETGSSLAGKFVRGDKIVCEVYGVAKPYSDSETETNGAVKASAAVTIANTVPVVEDGELETKEDTAETIELAPLATDADGDTMTFAVSATSANGGTVTVDAATGVATYTPAKDYFGEDSFTFTAIDSAKGTSEAGTISVNVLSVNDKPSATVATAVPFTRDNATGTYVATTAQFAVNVGPANESEQTVEAVDIVVTDEAGILASDPTFSYDSETRKLTMTATPVEQPDPAAKAYVKFKVKDNGGTENEGVDTSDEYTVMLCTNPPPELVAGSVKLKQNSKTITTIGEQTETSKAISVAMKAKDGSIEGAPAPSGIKGFQLAVFIDGEEQAAMPAWAKIGTNGKSSKAAVASFAATLTPSYDMIVNGEGGNRPSSVTVKFQVKATDGDGVNALLYESDEFTVTDVDRKTAAPKKVVLKGFDAEDKAVTKIQAAHTIKAVVTPADAATLTDADGDVPTAYHYVWKVNGTVVEGENGESLAGVFKRADKVICTVSAVTKPYSDNEAEFFGTEKASSAVTIVNTPPVASDGEADTLEDTATDIDLTAFVEDIDGDTMTYTADAKSANGATIKVVSKTGIATYTPVKNFSGDDTFKFKATDSASGKSNEATITVHVAPVNDKPTATVSAVAFDKDAATGKYVETTKAFTLYAGADDETDQTFQVIDIETTDESGLLASAPQLEVNGTTLNFTVTPVDEPIPGALATVKFKIQDNGGTENGGVDTSKEYSVTVCTNPPPALSGTKPANIADVKENDKAFKLSLKAADGKIDGAPAPSGVKSFELVAFINGEQQETLPAWVKVTTNRKSSGTSAASFVATATPAYTMIANGEGGTRDKSMTAKFQVFATDGDGVRALVHETNEFTITDVDQQTVAPTSVKLTGYKIVDSEVTDTTVAKPTAIDAIKAVVTPTIEAMNDAIAANPTGNKYDKDGDAVTAYKYTWKVNGTVVEETGDTLKGAFKRADKVICEVAAVTKPYGDEEVLGKSKAAKAVTIANSAPVVEDFAVETAEDVPVDIDLNSDEYKAHISDPDGDTFTFTADTTSAKGGKVTIKNGVITYTPKVDFSGEDSFKYTAKDKGGASAKATITVTVNDENDPPVVLTTQDFFVTSSDLEEGVEQTGVFTAAVGPASEKKNQAIASADFVVDPEFAAMITSIQGEPVLNETTGDYDINVTFTASPDAEIGAVIPVTVTVTDDGTPAATSEPKSFVIIIGDTPWYPVHKAVTTNLDNYDGIIFYVHLISSGKPSTSTLTILKVKKDENGECVAKPIHYYANNFAGLKPGKTYYFEEYYMKGSKTAGLATKYEAGNEDITETIVDYEKPDAKLITVKKAEDEEGAYDVNVPMGKSFVLKVYNSSKKIQKTFTQKFVPNEETGMIAKPFRLNFTFKEGYYVTVVGTNPLGSSTTAKLTYEQVMGEPSRAAVKPAVFPADGYVHYTAEDAADIDFTWPTLADATAYSLAVYNEAGEYVTGIESTELANATLNLEPGNYRWVVTTLTEDGALVDEGHAFTIVKEAEAPVVAGIATNGNDLAISLDNAVEGEELALDIQYVDAIDQLWNSATVTATVIDGKLVIEDVPAAAGAYIFVKFAGEENYSTYIVK